MAETHYILPSHPRVLCEDRFSILDSEELHVLFWDVLTTLLNTTKVSAPADVVDLLETISVVRRGRADSDYGFLKQFLSDHERKEQFFDEVWPQVKSLALEMPDVFHESRIPILGRGKTDQAFSRRQIACLVVHQFLCTLTAPTWQDGFQDFHIWYSSEQPHAKAVHAYLTALFEYFFRLTERSECAPLQYTMDEWPIRLTLHSLETQIALETDSIPLSELEILNLPESNTAPSLLGLPDGAAVISANKFIGFGRTGTQEEMHVGASPECCPAVLVTPPLQDDQVLVVTGPEAMIVVGGYQRDARCVEVLRPEKAADTRRHSERWSKRTMLFMDALELDLYDRDAGLPDLQPGLVDREFRKAYAAFSSYKQASRSAYATIFTGYWGCGTFGGNVGVKSLVQWCAASFAGSKMTFLCPGPDRSQFGDEFRRFANDIKEKTTAATIIEILRDLSSADVQAGVSVLEIVKAKVNR